MKVVYLSLTGQTRSFVAKLKADAYEISPQAEKKEIKEPFLLILPSYDYAVTQAVDRFVEYGDNLAYCRGVCGSGNHNFAKDFCFSAKDFSKKYRIPLVHCFEFRGSSYDVATVKGWMKENE